MSSWECFSNAKKEDEKRTNENIETLDKLGKIIDSCIEKIRASKCVDDIAVDDLEEAIEYKLGLCRPYLTSTSIRYKYRNAKIWKKFLKLEEYKDPLSMYLGIMLIVSHPLANNYLSTYS